MPSWNPAELSGTLVEAWAQLPRLRLVVSTLWRSIQPGVHASRSHGFSVVFSEHMPYVPGEDIRYLDWKVYARKRRLYLRKFEDESAIEVYVWLDASPSMFYPEGSFLRWKAGVLLTALTIRLCQQLRDRFSIGGPAGDPSAQLSPFPARSRPGDFARGFAWLESLWENSGNLPSYLTAEQWLNQWLSHAKGQGLLVWFSDMGDPLFRNVGSVSSSDPLREYLRAIRQRHYRVLAFQILHVPTEKDVEEMTFSDVRMFYDPENPRWQVALDPSSFAREYRSHFSRWQEQLRNLFWETGHEFYEVDCSRNPIPAFLEILHARMRIPR